MNSPIQSLDSWLQEHRPDFLAQLNPPATTEAIKELKGNYSETLPEEFVEYLEWHNGQPFDSQTLYDNRRLMPISEILETVRILNDCAVAGEFETDTWWLPSYLPFICDGGGNYVYLNLVNSSVCEYWKSDDDRPKLALTFSDWVNQLVSMLSTGNWLLQRGAYIRASTSSPADAWEKVNLVMLLSPQGGLAELKKIYEALALSYGIGRLFSDLKKGPVTLFNDIYYTDACRFCARVKDDTVFELHSTENPGQVYPPFSE